MALRKVTGRHGQLMYEWDETKSEANKAKHGVDFHIVQQFDWSAAVIIDDDRFDYGEKRGRAYGRIEGRGYCVVFTLRGDNTRVISLRPMHEKESKRYGI